MKKGTLCISLDTELLWGRHDGNWKVFLPRAQRARYVIDELLSLFTQYDVPATWAIVGHLFLKDCKRVKGTIHPEIVRANFPWLPGDWFTSDPGTSLAKNPEWYGADIIKKIKRVKNQDIGSHSFSHIPFGDPGVSRACAESEIRTCVRLAKKEGIKLSSFVFPYNSIGHLNILTKYGFTTFRGADRYSTTSSIDKFNLLVDLFMPVGSPVYLPKKVKRIVEIPGSFYFLSGRGIRKYIPKGVRFRKATYGIDRAIAENKIFHLWTHPIDFADQPDKLLSDFRRIIEYAYQKRKQGKLIIQNMKQITDRYI